MATMPGWQAARMPGGRAVEWAVEWEAVWEGCLEVQRPLEKAARLLNHRVVEFARIRLRQNLTVANK